MSKYYLGDGGSRKKLAPLATAFLIATVVPAYTNLGPVFMTPARAVLLIALPFLLLRLFSGLYGKILLNDIFVILMISWMSIAMLKNSPASALSYSGIQWPSTLGAYLVGRATIRSPDDFRAFVRVMGWIMLILLPLAIYETLSSHPLLPQLLTKIPGVVSIEDVNYRRRMGLDRAQVSFSHPIHFGFYCSLFVGLAFVAFYGVLDRTKRMLLVGLSVLNCIAAMSSGPLLAVFVQMGLISYGYVTFPYRSQWKIVLIGAAAFYVVLELASPYPALYEISKRIALDPATASYRALIFEYGTAQVGKTPIFGVGMNDWERPIWMLPSIDNHWLLFAVQCGMPSFLFLLGVFINSLSRAGGGRFRKGSDLYFIRFSWNIVLIGAMVTMSTVALFGEITGMVFFLLGAGQFLFTAIEPEETASEAKEPAVARRSIFGDLAADSAGAPAFQAQDLKAPTGTGAQSGRRTLLN